jgi:hypothetical protein
MLIEHFSFNFVDIKPSLYATFKFRNIFPGSIIRMNEIEFRNSDIAFIEIESIASSNP